MRVMKIAKKHKANLKRKKWARPGILRLPVPPVPKGMTVSDFGKKALKWGKGDAAAEARIKTLTRLEVSDAGVTRDMAQGWRNFYCNEKMRNPSNPSASGRFKLMQHAIDLPR